MAGAWKHQQPPESGFFKITKRNDPAELILPVVGGPRARIILMCMFDPRKLCLRACLKIPRGSVFGQKAGWRGATKENIPGGSSTEEQRSQRAFGAKTLWAAVLLAAAVVGSALKARFGDSRASPPRLRPKSLAAEPLAFLKHALRHENGLTCCL